MAVVQVPQSFTSKSSLFHRFSRREPSDRYASPRPWSKGQSQSNQSPQHTTVDGAGLPAHSDSLNSQTNKNSTPTSLKPDLPTHIRQNEVKLRPPLPHQNSQQRLSRYPQRVPCNALPTSSFPGTPPIRPWNIALLPSQIFSLYLGALPKDLSDKWFIYSEGPDQAGKLKIHFHGSWTGMKIAELFVIVDVKGEGAGQLVGFKWNDSADTNRMTESEAKYMILTTCEWTLGVQLERVN